MTDIVKHKETVDKMVADLMLIEQILGSVNNQIRMDVQEQVDSMQHLLSKSQESMNNTEGAITELVEEHQRELHLLRLELGK